MIDAPAATGRRQGRLEAILGRSFLVWERPVSAMLLAGLILLGVSATAGAPWRQSDSPYYNYLADAFLHGQLHLRLIPADTLDLSLYAGKYYLYWGPLPALTAMPLVAIFGVGVSDILQSLAVGALNVGLFAWLLRAATRRGLIEISPTRRALMVLFFALGTAHTPLPGAGRVWYIVQLYTVTCVLLAYLAAFALEKEKAFFWSGLALSGILLTRASAMFSAIFLAWYLINRYQREGMRALLRYSLCGVAPLLAVGALTVLYNAARFSGPLDFGMAYQLMNPGFQKVFDEYGFFNTYFIPTNLYLWYVLYPISFKDGLFVTAWGGSIFLLSPLFFAALTALWSERRRAATWVLVVTFLLGNIPLMLLMGPGSFNFGPRYALDFTVPLMLLTAMGVRRWPGWLCALALAISLLHYLLGALMLVHAT